MRISIPLNVLRPAVARAAKVLPGKATIAITAAIKFQAGGDHLEITATDLETTIRVRVPAQVEEPGGVCLPGDVLGKLINELPPGEIAINASEKDFRAVLTCPAGTYKIGGENPAGFPAFPAIPPGSPEFTLPNTHLARLFERTAFAVSSDQLRPSLCGVYLECGGGIVRAVSTDGHRLGLYEVPGGVGEGEVAAIIPANFLKHLPGGDIGETIVSLGGKHAQFRDGESTLWCRLIEEAFVEYQRVIPQDTHIHVVADLSAVLSAVRRVALFSDSITTQVVLRLDPAGGIILSAQNPHDGGEAKETVPAETSGLDTELLVGFNARYLISGIKNVCAGKIRLRIFRNDHAVLLEPAGDDLSPGHRQLILQMPLRLEDV